jgi:ubiquinone/menaquinone biosynthesis C-methylase UbiE/Flp pilus assembly protein TadD
MKKNALPQPYDFVFTNGIRFENVNIKPLEILKLPQKSELGSEFYPELDEALECIKKSRFDSAIKIYKNLFKKNPENFHIGNVIGALLGHTKDYKAAESIVKKILLKEPHNIIALNNLASIYIKQFEYGEKTEKIIKKILSSNAVAPEIYHNTGVYFHRQNKFSEALRYYNLALMQKKIPESYTGLGFIALREKNLKVSEENFLAALKLNPYEHIAIFGLSLIETRKNNPEIALSLAAQAVNIDPLNYYYLLNFQNLGKDNQTASHKPELIQALIHYLSYPRLRHRTLFALWGNLVTKSSELQKFRFLTILPESDLNEKLWNKLWDEISHPFLYMGIRECMITSVHWENALIRIRRKILELFIQNDLPEVLSNHYLYAQAELCFFNEYIFEITPEERAHISELQRRIADQQGDFEKAILILSSYEPLYKSAFEELASAAKIDNPNYRRFIRYQIEEPAIEVRNKKNIRSVGTIQNEVSSAVKAQYEDNPYPRWKHLYDYQGELKDINQKVIIDSRKKVLIAGCGTGQQVVGHMALTQNYDVTAIDISAASIAYAKRKTDEIGFKNLKYLMCDILEVKNLKTRFNYIYCTGVLHHMQNPFDGWKALYDVLESGGEMKIALYSNLARQSVIECRKLIEKEGFQPTLGDMRALRSFIKTLPKDHSLRKLENWTDFYSTSMFRDLVFHVQEHRYTIPEIKDTLDQLGLKFMGFDKDSSSDNGFQALNADPKARLDLQRWHDFEQKNPDAFMSMYTFVCQKP